MSIRTYVISVMEKEYLDGGLGIIRYLPSYGEEKGCWEIGALNFVIEDEGVYLVLVVAK